MSDLGPYGDNILINGLGPIPNREDMTRRLLNIPSGPKDIARIPISRPPSLG